MGGDLQKELAVLTTMNRLPGRSAAQGETAEHERTGVVSDRLVTISPLRTDHLDGIELLESLLGDPDLWEDRMRRHKIAAWQLAGPDRTWRERRASPTRR
jgi:hypothetical protein